MRLPLSGFAFLLGYIVLVGVASFLEKFSMKQLNPYQVNFLMAIGMAVTAWETEQTWYPPAPTPHLRPVRTGRGARLDEAMVEEVS